MLKFYCNCIKGSYCIKLEADFVADPIWCGECGKEIPLEKIMLSVHLKKELSKWAADYGVWIDFENDCLCENGIHLEEEHNKKGEELAKKIEEELGKNFSVIFKESRSAQMYSAK